MYSVVTFVYYLFMMVFHIYDITLKITDWLDDKDSVSLFSVNKNVGDMMKRYKLKEYYKFNKIKQIKCIVTKVKKIRYSKNVQDIPKSVTHLIFEEYFNKPVDKLPQSVTHLTFGHKFNQSVNNLPQSLTHLIFGEQFNQLVTLLGLKSQASLPFTNSYNFTVAKKALNFSPGFSQINFICHL